MSGLWRAASTCARNVPRHQCGCARARRAWGADVTLEHHGEGCRQGGGGAGSAGHAQLLRAGALHREEAVLRLRVCRQACGATLASSCRHHSLRRRSPGLHCCSTWPTLQQVPAWAASGRARCGFLAHCRRAETAGVRPAVPPVKPTTGAPWDGIAQALGRAASGALALARQASAPLPWLKTLSPC